MRKIKLYIETSVWNFYYADDSPEKRDITIDFFNNLSFAGLYEIYYSDVVLNEISKADTVKQELLIGVINKFLPVKLELTTEIADLAKKYIEEKIIPEKKIEDALHAAVSSFYELDALISWNYKHLANLNKAEKINALNLREGYRKRIEIVTPMEVYASED